MFLAIGFAHALKTLAWFSLLLGERQIIRSATFGGAVYASVLPSVAYHAHTHRRPKVLGTWVYSRGIIKS